MDAFKTVSGKVAPMLASNIDTDVIMPKQFLKGIDRNGLDRGVFFDQRFLSTGELNPEFVLNKAKWRGAKFLAVGANFGCGSSREHAVWGLKQLGIRALIGTSFAGIFYDNCQRNGLLVIELENQDMARFSKQVATGQIVDLEIDLVQQLIKPSAKEHISFTLDPLRKEALLKGLDAIGSTLQYAELIKEFETKHLQQNPWLS